MIQRIQTVYLLIAFILLSCSLIFPLASFSEGVKLFGYGFTKEGINLYVPYGIFTIGGLCALLAFVEVFLFKDRKRQMQMGLINSFFILFYYITIGAYAMLVGIDKLNLQFVNIGVAAILPIIALVFNILAYSKIKADENLIKSMDRIR